jgi:glutamyl-tRNA synthetase
MTVVVRFAPSPTGRLHAGNGRIALANWLLARKSRGHFILRLDDTDAERCRPEFAAAIEADLRWLGLDWDRLVRQSDRLARYAAAADALRASGRLYACYETAEELELARKLMLARRRPPIYDRAGQKLTAPDRAKLEAQGRRPHWRFLLDRKRREWTDLVRGPTVVETSSLSDPVLVREDGRPTYTLASVVDDIELGVTHVVRGEDHVTNTGAQIEIAAALGAAMPQYAHLSLLTAEGGGGLSKREGSLSLGDLQAEGIEPLALASLLARLGTSTTIALAPSMAALAEEFELGRFGRSPAQFDTGELAKLNRDYLHQLDFVAAAPRLAALGLGAAGEAFWLAVRGNIERIDAAREWWEVCNGPIAPRIEDRELLSEAARNLPPEPWSRETWRQWTQVLQKSSAKSGRALFHPLRLALTARERGPELRDLLPLIGRARALARLTGETA